MSKNTVFFDLDETLYPDYKLTDNSLMAICKEISGSFHIDAGFLRTEIEKAAEEEWLNSGLEEYYQRMGLVWWEGLWGNFTAGAGNEAVEMRSFVPGYREKVWTRALESAGINNIELAAELSWKFPRYRAENHELFSETLQVLIKLREKGYKLGIITNGIPDLQQNKIAGTSIAEFFDSVTISVAEGIGKPEKEIFFKALEALESNLEEVVMVGDSLRSDIGGAHNAGIKAVWINRKTGFEGKATNANEQPEAEIHNLDELLSLLDNLEDVSEISVKASKFKA